MVARNTFNITEAEAIDETFNSTNGDKDDTSINTTTEGNSTTPVVPPIDPEVIVEPFDPLPDDSGNDESVAIGTGDQVLPSDFFSKLDIQIPDVLKEYGLYNFSTINGFYKNGTITSNYDEIAGINYNSWEFFWFM
jgi:hypothetical protein